MPTADTVDIDARRLAAIERAAMRAGSTLSERKAAELAQAFAGRPARKLARSVRRALGLPKIGSGADGAGTVD